HNTGQAIKTYGHTTVLNCILSNISASSNNPTISSGSYNCAVKNCYANNSGSGSAYGSNLTLTTCASDDSTGTSGLTSVAYSTSTGAKFVSITDGSEDFHLQSGSALISAGTDLSATF